MIMIDRAKVTALFMRLCTIPNEERDSLEEIVENACYFVAKRLSNDTLVTDMERVEFACAAVAVYDRTLLKLIADKTLCTADGRQAQSYKDSDSYKYAVKLREHAIASISDIWEGGGFSFQAVEG